MLNAKQHEREAEIVAQAGRFGAVTIATNMAGRGYGYCFRWKSRISIQIGFKEKGI